MSRGIGWVCNGGRRRRGRDGLCGVVLVLLPVQPVGQEGESLVVLGCGQGQAGCG